ncbi:hypothetical protein BCR39DRAFT_314242 [Naematelia encephala]|uniref:HotDog domain-containing protein n=1 Tax=Naematelia encephala TaxID=71784 RepID=A0A1Y2AQL4_9TREE|nr:hypothetical protein BCR39DRAFT_314242 [Naematelia encephala]
MTILDTLIQLPTNVLTVARNVLTSLLDPSTPLVPFIPKPLKLLFVLLVLLNAPSFPFVWHYRIFRHPISTYLKVYRKGRERYIDEWKKESDARGGMKQRSRLWAKAWIDECDYNMHLSNSSYPKRLDEARMDWMLKAMSPAFTPKSHMALASTHFIFIKEIPMGSDYVMESRVGGWGDKWMYMVTEFIIYPKKGRKGGKGKKLVDPKPTPAGPAMSTDLNPIATAASSTSASPSQTGTSTPVTLEEVKRSANLRMRHPREDGGVVCCLAVSEGVFKMGRVTVPPRIAMFLALLSPSKADQVRAKNIILNVPDRGRHFLRGGWRDEPDAATLGADIGHEGGLSTAEEEEEKWFQKGMKGMDMVNEGLGVF